jgi:glutamate synthase domain-containing protein 3
MSGGLAYVYDADGTFPVRCNPGMVDLEPLEPSDEATLKTLLGRHAEYTGSTVARKLLDDWSATAPKFVKVFPREYKRVLAEQKYDTEMSALATGM